MIEPFHTELLARYSQGRMDMNASVNLPEYVFALQYMTAAAFIQGMASMVSAMMLNGQNVLAQVGHGERTPNVRRSARCK